MVIDLWEKIGTLDEMDSANVLAKLFTIYELKLQKNSEDQEAIQFFETLKLVVDQVDECNLNRR